MMNQEEIIPSWDNKKKMHDEEEEKAMIKKKGQSLPR